jgi:hypothetical protein
MQHVLERLCNYVVTATVYCGPNRTRSAYLQLSVLACRTCVPAGDDGPDAIYDGTLRTRRGAVMRRGMIPEQG